MVEPAGRGRASILRPADARERIRVGRREPGAALAPYVDYLWWVRWNADLPHRQEVIPAPVVHVAAEWHDGEPRLLVTGVQRRMFVRTLAGRGHVVAACFRPACFRPLLRSDVSALTDRQVAAGDVLGHDDRATAATLLQEDVDDDAMVSLLTTWLAAIAPEPDPLAEELAALVETIERDRSLVRAAQVARLAGTSLRTLQRQFGEYVGVPPKWVVQRFRLLDVAAAAHADEDVDWAGLAVELGYTDQSHLIRGFTALVGAPPATYAQTGGRAASAASDVES